MDTIIDYTNPMLDSYRSFTHDVVLIHGFTMKRTTNGAVKAKFTIKDGLRLVLFLRNRSIN